MPGLLKGLFFRIPVPPFPALPLPSILKVLADHCYSSWHLESADASQLEKSEMLLLRPEGPGQEVVKL